MPNNWSVDYGESVSKSTAWPKQPAWFEKGSDIKNIMNGLVKSGMNEKDAFKILGSNWLEFMKVHF